MALGRRKQRRVHAAVRDAMGDYFRMTESRLHTELERSRQLDQAVVAAVQELRQEFYDRDRELAQALEHVARAVEQTNARIDFESLERRALVDAVLALAQTTTVPDSLPPPPPERVIGGVVSPTGDIDLTDG
jgi:hypothetical protein